MKIIALISISLTLLSGCATEYGKRYFSPAIVQFMSDSPQLYYFLISREENQELGGGYEPLGKNEKVIKLLNGKIKTLADGRERRLNQGDVILLLDCENYFRRELIYFGAIVTKKLSCS